MTNKSKSPSNTNSSDQSNQKNFGKDSFEQGMQNNNSTDPGQQSLNTTQRGDQNDITNQDRKVTNEDHPVKQEQPNKMAADDDGDAINREDQVEIETPHTKNEKTERKLPEMNK